MSDQGSYLQVENKIASGILFKPMKKILILLLVTSCGPSLTLDEKITKAHSEYSKRASGYQSSFLPRVGNTRADDYKNCIQQRYYRNEDQHDFCSWHAGIGKYQ